VMVASGAAALAGVVLMARWGFANKHPVLGIVGGLFLAGPAAGAIAGNVTRLIVGPSDMVPAASAMVGGGPAPLRTAGANAN
jgi:hypothetical protein